MLSAPAQPICRHSLGKDGQSAEGDGRGACVCPWFLTALLLPCCGQALRALLPVLVSLGRDSRKL